MLHYKKPFSLFNGDQTDKGRQTGIAGSHLLGIYFAKFLSLQPKTPQTLGWLLVLLGATRTTCFKLPPSSLTWSFFLCWGATGLRFKKKFFFSN